MKRISFPARNSVLSSMFGCFLFMSLTGLVPPLFAEADLDSISLPEGFSISMYGKVEEARSLVRGDKGTIFIGTRKAGKVFALVDEDGDFEADKSHTIAQGLRMPNGVAFRKGSLYVAEVSRILRYDNIESRLADPPEPVVVTEALPSDKHHGWKYIAFGPNDYLYVPVGAPCNVCDEPEPYSSILRMRPDGSDSMVYATGIRNTVGFDFHPATGDLWFTNNGRDWMGDTLPPDSLHHAPKPGLDFGFPHCHAGVPDPELNPDGDCAQYAPPALELPAHVAPLGMTFYTGEMFPAEYKDRVFIAEHGSWNRTNPIGYRITTARIQGNTATDYTVFAEGWLDGDSGWGRPVDILQLPDGSLLASDDRTGNIYRITYGK